MKQPELYCQSKVANLGSSFYYSFLFLPPEQRKAVTAIYAFCREIDAIVTEASNIEIAQQKIVWWSSEIGRVFQGAPQHPVGIVLAATVRQFPLQKIWFEEILQSASMDLRYHGYQTFTDLNLYCHCVASTVAMLTASIFGYTNPKTLEYAKNLGLALQVIKIIRNVGKDARSGRIYIPEEELHACGIKAEDILQLPKQNMPQLSQLLAKLAVMAREYYATAITLLPPEDRAAQRSGLIMAQIHFSILAEIENANFAVLQQRISITPLRKLWIAWRTWRKVQVDN